MKIITAIEAKKRLNKNEILLIDVRSNLEYSTNAIKGAHLIPLEEISLKNLPLKSKPIVIHCRSGKRSLFACEKLLQEDPTLDLYSLDGGIIAWQEAGFDVIKPELAKPIRIPIDRQIHIVAGFVVLAGVLAGNIISSKFYIMTTFAGVGLIFSGLTGWCGMRMLLSKMPWNK